MAKIIPSDLVCYEESGIQKWAMISKSDQIKFYMQLLKNPSVKKHSIFVIPKSSILSGLWLWKKTHKSQHVDFSNFFEDYDCSYQSPQADEKVLQFEAKYHERYGDHTKYGWIAPDGRYFHCEYQGHISLAERICFGLADTENPERYLEEHRWCKIYKPLFSNEYTVYLQDPFKITKEQFHTLDQMNLSHTSSVMEILKRG